MKKFLLIIVPLILLVVAGFAYWYFFFHGPGSGATVTVSAPPRPTSNGFVPLSTGSPIQATTNADTSNQIIPTAPVTLNQPAPVKIAVLRMLSETPVGGYAASTIASTTRVRWIDRGRGNVYELPLDSETVTTLSNTIVPRMYQSVWNKNLSAFVGSIFTDGATAPTTLYGELRAQSASTSGSISSSALTPLELRGKNLPDNIIAYAASPKRDKLFTLINENGNGVGYISNFDGTKPVKLFDTPLTQINVEWPADNTLTITTKGTIAEGGVLYFINVKTGAWKKILGPLAGLSTRTSHDARYVLASSASNDQNVDTAIYAVATGTLSNASIRTLADKCVWGNFYATLIYCAVPSQPVQGVYPDDWYTGTLSTIDKIWQLNAVTGEVHLISNIVDQSDRVIDAFNLGLDPKDNYLFFMNKNDLSLWSLDLVRTE